MDFLQSSITTGEKKRKLDEYSPSIERETNYDELPSCLMDYK